MMLIPAGLEAPPITDADSPFDDKNADIIIRSSDKVDFRLSKFILSSASAVFRDMFTHALPAPFTLDIKGDELADIRDGLPVVRLSEPSDILRLLFQYLYPMDNPSIDDSHDIFALVRAMDKYSFDRFSQTITSLLHTAMRSNPHTVYAFACHYHSGTPSIDIARDAAIETLIYPMLLTRGPLVRESELLQMTSVELQDLLKFHWDCAKAVVGIVQGMFPGSGTSKMPEDYPCSMSTDSRDAVPPCGCKRVDIEITEGSAGHQSITIHRQTTGEFVRRRFIVNHTFTAPDWVFGYLKGCEKLLAERPHWTTLMGGKAQRMMEACLEDAGVCGWCEWRAKDQVPKLRERLVAQIEQSVRTVRRCVT